MLNWFKHFDPKKKNSQFFIQKNVSIPSDQNMSQGAGCCNTPVFYTTDIV